MKFNTSAPTQGKFVKVQDFLTAKAILVEPKSFKFDIPGRYGPQDIAVCDLTVFDNDSMLSGEEPPRVLQAASISKKKSQPKNAGEVPRTNQLIEHLKQLKDNGEAGIYKVHMKTATGIANPFAEFTEVDRAVQEAVIDYATNREKKIEADAAEAPSFDE